MDEREDPTPVQPVPVEPSKKVTITPGKNPPSFGWRRFRFITPKALVLVIGALSTTGVTWFQLFRGEPGAKEAQNYVSGPIKAQLATLERDLRRVHTRQVAYQLEQQCDRRTAAVKENFELKIKLDDSHRMIVSLQQQLGKKVIAPVLGVGGGGITTPATSSGQGVITVLCRDGYADVKGKCKRVSKDVAETIQKHQGETAAAKMQVEIEAFKRKQAENGKQQLKKLLIQKAADPPEPMPPAPWEQKKQ